MTTDNQRVYLDELSKRWQQSPDKLLEMAAKNKLRLWFEFHNVIVQKVKKKKTPTAQIVETIEIPLQAEMLEMMIGRTDRIQVAAQYSCVTSKGKPVLISNAAGEEWGETSMVGLNPMRLYARAEDLPQIESKQEIIPFGTEAAASSCCCQSHQEEEVRDEDAFISADHPCFAPELHIALECWLKLMGDEDSPDVVQKSDILEWLRGHYPKLTKTATERIALVVMPAPKQKQ
ncbi:MAG: hypothetical protein AB7U29_18625 [Desulfobulbus sp.]